MAYVRLAGSYSQTIHCYGDGGEFEQRSGEVSAVSEDLIAEIQRILHSLSACKGKTSVALLCNSSLRWVMIFLPAES